MNLTLKRTEFRADGIYGELFDQDGEFESVTLEHAYPAPSGDFIPKIPPGEYVCQRSMHKLMHMQQAFETFEITDVPGHFGVLFHVGNYNHDSDGCVLIGTEITEIGGNQMLTGSKVAFQRFMKAQEGVNEFKLTVE